MPDKIDLRELFKSKGITSLAVAKSLGVSKSNIARLCDGTRPLGSLQANAIANLLGVSVAEVWAAYDVHAQGRYKQFKRTGPETGPDLKTLITSKGMTLAALAVSLDLNASGITRLVSGKRGLSNERAEKIATLLNVEPAAVVRAYEVNALPQFKRQNLSTHTTREPNALVSFTNHDEI
jgi:transcriptional regulator with XRE-family HTH domain